MLGKLIDKIRGVHSAPLPEKALMNAYARAPVSFVRGDGALLWDDQGREYLDALGGIAVCFLGHSHPKISEAISLQASKLLHTSNLFQIPQQAQLGERFCAISGMEKVFFGNSGAEANEAAIKISRLFAREKNISDPIVICAKHSFHGRTFGALSATGNEAIQTGLHPLLSGFVHVPYDDIEAMRAYSNNPNVVAIMIEPVQGEAGIIVPEQGYLTQLRKLCDENDWLLMIDEIQTGIGRTGKWFAFQHEDILPDVLCSAKALGNGIPIGACAARGKAANLITPGAHGTTFGGNPFASQVALTVLNIIEQEQLLKRATELGQLLKQQLQQQLCNMPQVKAIRGKGLMLGIELDKVYPNLAQAFLKQGMIVNVTGGGKVIRMLPSVMLSDAQAKQIVQICEDLITSLK